MGALDFFGNALIAYGPALVFIFLYIGHYPQLVLLSLLSAFIWSLSMIFTGVIWIIIPPLKLINPFTMAVSILFQELLRLLLVRILKRAEKGLSLTAEHPESSLNQYRFALATGFGYGLANALVMYGDILSSSTGPGTVFAPACPSTPVPFLSSWIYSIFIWLNTCWSILLTDSYSKKDYKLGIWAVACHFLASFSTLFNASTLQNGCAASIIVPLLLLFICIYQCYKIIQNVPNDHQI